MGQFSWIYSDTKKQVVDNKNADTYLLVPKLFQNIAAKNCSFENSPILRPVFKRCSNIV